MLKLSFLGSPIFELAGQQFEIRAGKSVALLAYIAVTGQIHSRDTLGTLLWPDKDQSQARTYLRHALWTVKKALGERWFIASRDQIGLQMEEGIWLDVQAFKENITAVTQNLQSTGPLDEDCLNQLQEAVALYRDDFLSGFTLPDSPAFDEWQFFEAEALRQLYAGALERLVQEYTNQQAYDAAITNARRWLTLDPLHEPVHQILMRLYALDGQQAAALRQYQKCVRLLDEELGIEPDKETTTLYKNIRSRQLCPPDPAVPSPNAGPQQPTERFLIKDLLDKGTHGEVYLGQDTLTEKPVIIKRLRSDAVETDQNLVGRFMQEAEALQQLNHPNIVCFLDMFEQDGRPHLVMEYVPDGSLSQRLKQEPQLTLNQILTIALELADALARAHHLNIIHRDIKPENVLLTPDGSPRLIDFGIARLMKKEGRITGAGTLLGSPAYMGPEIIQGAESNVRSEIWSYGVLLFEMLAGQRPFPEEQITAVMASILNNPTPDIRQNRPESPQTLAELINRLLAKAPEKRPNSMRLVAAQLQMIRDNLNQEDSDGAETNIMLDQYLIPKPLSHLPSLSASFIGRKSEQDDLIRSLQNPICRLITITGPGGIGKTQLATALGASVTTSFPDGLYFVPLAPLQSAGDIINEIGNVIGFQFSNTGDPLEQLLRFLNRKHMLLILDNFEHLISGTAIVSQILEAAPSIKMIITSRERLNLSNEIVYPLPGLSFPEKERVEETDIHNYSAVQLLLQRAEAVRPNLEIDAHSIPHIVRICRLVDGNPLALIMAASWFDLLSFEEVAGEIEHGLDFLQTELIDVPDRQRSMRAIFDASWQRLSSEEQQALMSLIVFRGGFNREAAQAVAKSGPLTMKRLVNKSLLLVNENGRFDLHELLRQYVNEHLQEAPQVAAESRERHANYYTTLLNNLDGALKEDQQKEALNTIGAELENVRATWRWWIQQERWEKIIYNILPSLFRYCELRFRALFLFGLIEETLQGLSISKAAKNPGHIICTLQTAKAAFFYTGILNRLKFENEAQIGEKDAVLIAWQYRRDLIDHRSLRWQIMLAFLYGQLINLNVGIETLESLLPTVRSEASQWALAFTQQCLGHLLLLAKSAEAEAHLKAALDQFQNIGDIYEIGITRYLMGLLFIGRQQLVEAQTQFLLAQQLFLDDIDTAIFALMNWNLADVYVGLGENEKSINCLRQSFQILIDKGLVRSALAFLSRESYESLRYGSIDQAIEVGEECLSIVTDADDPLGEPWYNWELGEIYRVKGNLVQARQYYERALALFKHNKDHHDPTFFQQGMAFYNRGLGNIAIAQQKFEDAEAFLRESLRIARVIDHHWITAYAAADLGRVLLSSGQREQARDLFIEALKLAKQMANGGMAMIALAGVTMLYTVQERWNQAEELGTIILNHPLTWRETRSQVAALLNLEVPIPNDQPAESTDQNWAWIDIVDRQLEKLSDVSR